jgi:hypothetical protein
MLIEIDGKAIDRLAARAASACSNIGEFGLHDNKRGSQMRDGDNTVLEWTLPKHQEIPPFTDKCFKPVVKA